MKKSIDKNGLFLSMTRDDIAKIDYVQALQPTERIDNAHKRIGCDIIINANFFDMKTGASYGEIVDEGKVIAAGNYSPYGYGFPDKKFVVFDYKNQKKNKDFCNGYPCLLKDTKLVMDTKEPGFSASSTVQRGRTVMGDSINTLIIRCIPDTTSYNRKSVKQMAELLKADGCINAINLDGGGSSQFITPWGKYISGRPVDGFICIWLKKESTPPPIGGDKMKKVFIGVGHGGSDPGAIGANGIKEANINLNIARYLRNELQRHGVEVKMSRDADENDSLTDEIRECNAFAPTLAIDVHTNAGGGRGFEAYVSAISTSQGTALGKNIEAEVVKMGQISRGIKTRLDSAGKDYYGFVRETKCTAIIVEGGFIDTAEDLKLMNTYAGQEKFAIAYAKGILKFLGIAWKDNTPKPEPEPEKPEESKLYRVQVGAFSEKANAEKLKKELEDKGYKAIIV